MAENPLCELVPMASSDKAYTWIAMDCSETAPAKETLAIRFATAEQAQKFIEAWEAGKKFNKTLKEGSGGTSNTEGGENLVYAPVVEDDAHTEKKGEESKEEKKENAKNEVKSEDKKEEKTEEAKKQL